MNTARSGPKPVELEVGLEASGAGGRRRCAARSRRAGPRCSRSSRIRPAQVPSTGVPLRDELAQRLGQPLALDAERHRGGLAAGDHQPVEPLEVLARAHRARLGAELRERPAWASKSPWRASTPIDRATASTSRGSAAGRRPPRACRSRCPAMASPSSREAAATRSGSSKCVVASTIARARRCGIGGLEDPRAHEVALGAELHHQRGVGRGGDAAGAEQHDGQPALLGHVAHQLERRLELLRRAWAAPSRRATRSRRISPVIRRMWRTASTTLPVPASPLERIIAAPSAIRRSASPRLVAPQTNGTLKACLSMWCASSAGREHLGLVDVVHLERLEHLGLDEVADARLGHHGDGHGLLDLLDLGRVGHARHAAVGADVGGHALQRHHGGRARVLGDLRLLGGDHVHDHAALEHLGEAGLDSEGAGLHGHISRIRPPGWRRMPYSAGLSDGYGPVQPAAWQGAAPHVSTNRAVELQELGDLRRRAAGLDHVGRAGPLPSSGGMFVDRRRRACPGSRGARRRSRAGAAARCRRPRARRRSTDSADCAGSRRRARGRGCGRGRARACAAARRSGAPGSRWRRSPPGGRRTTVQQHLVPRRVRAAGRASCARRSRSPRRGPRAPGSSRGRAPLERVRVGRVEDLARRGSKCVLRVSSRL